MMCTMLDDATSSTRSHSLGSVGAAQRKLGQRTAILSPDFSGLVRWFGSAMPG